ncbi:MAG: DUF1566 domain-containing protein [Sedimentisphaerales bacterium]|nr:DUF1566 domain-containing protein [Sedimentisphaerales bacterium]
MFVPIKHIISRGLPKTGQTTSYITTDDGDTEAGWWQKLSAAQNRSRFVLLTISGDDVVIDRATGLMWAADGSQAGGNNGNMIKWYDGAGSALSDYPALNYAYNLTFAGYSDWRLPNILEMISIVNYQIDAPMKYSEFSNLGEEPVDYDYWTSTTRPALGGSNAYYVSFYNSTVNNAVKTYIKFILCVRGGTR